MRTTADSASQVHLPRRRRIGVFLPVSGRGELLDTAINHALMLKMGSEAAGEGVDVVVSYAAGDSGDVRNLRRLAESRITVRETTWQPISKEELGVAGRYMGVEYQLDAPAYAYPSDGASNFLDCDFWYVIADRNGAPLAPLRRYAIYVNDCFQRYLPELLAGDGDAGFIATTRRSAVALCTTPFTRDDLVQYVGLPARKVALVAPSLRPVSLPGDAAGRRTMHPRAYFLWQTDVLPHGNHEIALRGIQRYVENLDGNLDVVIAGPDTDQFDPRTEPGEVSAHVRRVRQQLAKRQLSTERIRWVGNVDHDEYASFLSGAQWLFDPSLIDAAPLRAAEAAGFGVPTLSSDYPPMRFYDATFGLGATFFDASDENAIATALKDAESRLTELKRRLPVPADLAKFDLGGAAPSLWNVVRQHV